MSGEAIEGLGTMAEGAALGRTAEPDRGEGARGGKGHFHETACLNCGAELTGAYCARCGQAAHLHRTIGAFFHDLLHGVLHVEGKTWRTLPMLAVRPGRLTREYVAGKRARYVSPMGLFLFSIFLMFAVFQVAGISAPTTVDASGEQVAKGVTTTLQQARAKQEEVEARLAAMPADDPARKEAEAEMAKLEEDLRALETTERYMLSEHAWVTIGKTGIPLIDKGIKKWRDNPGLMLYKLQANSYKFSWLLIPLSLPFVWLLFAWKREYNAYDHTVFITYSLSFMTLVFIAITLLGLAGIEGTILAALAVFVPLAHIYKHMRGAYELRRFSAIWRLAAMTVFIAAILMIFLQILFLLGIF